MRITVHEVEGIYRLRELIRRTRRQRDCDAKEVHEERLRSRATTTRKLQIERNRRELIRRTRRKIAMKSNNNKKENCKLKEIVTN